MASDTTLIKSFKKEETNVIYWIFYDQNLKFHI